MRGNGQIRTRKKLGERRREKRKKLFKGLGKLTLILSLIAGLAFAGKKAEDFLLTSHFFRIKEVNFKGATFLRQEVLEKLANIKLGKNIFRVNLRAIQERLERNPRVREAIISRAFPNAVTVNIREREAVALFESGGEAYPVDREGVVLPRLGRANPFSHSLPLIKGVKGYELKVGKKLQCPKLTVALELLAALASSGLKVNSYGINLGGPELILANKKTKVLLGELSTVKHGETPQSSADS
ncbi:FtsQ-type POTRA domain-containing protein, partial [bacterium]|nr:FtsQ-type POTRA domain-containing protein [bacterium]